MLWLAAAATWVIVIYLREAGRIRRVTRLALLLLRCAIGLVMLMMYGSSSAVPDDRPG